MNYSARNMIAAAILSIGLIGAAWTLGSQFGRLKDAGVITVKGLAEAEYRAGTGTWRIGILTWGKDYASALNSNLAQQKNIQTFLAEQGFGEDQIKTEEIDVSEKHEMYVDDKGNEQMRKNGYNAERYYVVSTNELDKLQKAVRAVQQFRAENETVVFFKPQYYLDDLEKIKRMLISQATQDAYVRAEEFAKTGKMKVGNMQSASQGSFDIQASTSSDNTDSNYGGDYDTTTIDKRVRLVVTIQYRIDN